MNIDKVISDAFMGIVIGAVPGIARFLVGSPPMPAFDSEREMGDISRVETSLTFDAAWCVVGDYASGSGKTVEKESRKRGLVVLGVATTALRNGYWMPIRIVRHGRDGCTVTVGIRPRWYQLSLMVRPKLDAATRAIRQALAALPEA